MEEVTGIQIHLRIMERAESITVAIRVTHHIETGQPSENDGKAI